MKLNAVFKPDGYLQTITKSCSQKFNLNDQLFQAPKCNFNLQLSFTGECVNEAFAHGLRLGLRQTYSAPELALLCKSGEGTHYPFTPDHTFHPVACRCRVNCLRRTLMVTLMNGCWACWRRGGGGGDSGHPIRVSRLIQSHTNSLRQSIFSISRLHSLRFRLPLLQLTEATATQQRLNICSFPYYPLGGIIDYVNLLLIKFSVYVISIISSRKYNEFSPDILCSVTVSCSVSSWYPEKGYFNSPGQLICQPTAATKSYSANSFRKLL